MKPNFKEYVQTKEQVLDLLDIACEDAQENSGIYKYKVKVNDWTAGDKDRTYFNIVETKKGTKHYKSYRCGYYDNKANKYVVDEINEHDLNDTRYTVNSVYIGE